MNSSEYNQQAATTDVSTHTLDYYLKGLVEELGEFYGHLKRIDRDDNGELTEERWVQMQYELGDFFWYLARAWDRICEKKGWQFVPFEKIMELNIQKLADRKKRNVLHGEGSNR